jgi:phage gp36-like protein
MRYCTLQDLIDTYGQARIAELTDRVNMPATTIDETIVNRAIDDAGAEINLYLAGRHALPLTSVPVMLTRIACDLAWRNLHTQVPDDHPAEKARQTRLKQLDGIASGKLNLGLDAADVPVPTSNTVQVAPGCNDFARGGW